jgi:uncharacterized protein (TIGR02145 family)
MKLLFTSLLSLFLSFSLFGQSPCNNQTSVTYQGYEYDIVEIGDQCWFAENCRYLPSVSPSVYGTETESYYYVYNYEGTDVEAAKATNNYQIYGALYNWPAVMESGVCPSGWHIPSDDEFTQLADYLGGWDVGGQMKETGLGHWYSPNTGATNSSGWTGFPGGIRGSWGFAILGIAGIFWSSSMSDVGPWRHGLENTHDNLYRDNDDYREYGLSARCVTNQLIVEIGLDYDGNGDGCVDGEDLLNFLSEYGQCD